MNLLVARKPVAPGLITVPSLTTYVVQDNARSRKAQCRGCAGCGDARGLEFELPATRMTARGVDPADTTGSLFRLSIRPGNQLYLLTHSLVLPLGGFIGGSALASLVGNSDGVALLGALVGLVLGVRLCRTGTIERIELTEVN